MAAVVDMVAADSRVAVDKAAVVGSMVVMDIDWDLCCLAVVRKVVVAFLTISPSQGIPNGGLSTHITNNKHIRIYNYPALLKGYVKIGSWE